jgi:hypothetical protein
MIWTPEHRRARRWRRLLDGPNAFSTWDIGGCHCGGGGYPCGSCTIPASDLTVSWTNPIIGNGSAPLIYSTTPSTQWASACTNQILYELICVAGSPVFQVTYYISGSCPTGGAQTCRTDGANPFKLTSMSLTCGSSFLWTIGLSSSTCPGLLASGYTGFTVST